jgi:hypothetical protein
MGPEPVRLGFPGPEEGSLVFGGARGRYEGDALAPAGMHEEAPARAERRKRGRASERVG